MSMAVLRQGNNMYRFIAQVVRESSLVGVRFRLVGEQWDTPFASVCCSSEHAAFSELQQLPDDEIQSIAVAVLSNPEHLSQAIEFRQAAAPAYVVLPMERSSVA